MSVISVAHKTCSSTIIADACRIETKATRKLRLRTEVATYY